MGRAALEGTPLQERNIFYFSCFFSAQNLQNNYNPSGFDGHFNALRTCDEGLFSLHRMLPRISADLQALQQTPGGSLAGLTKDVACRDFALGSGE